MKSFEYIHIAVVIYSNHAVTVLSVLACHAVKYLEEQLMCIKVPDIIKRLPRVLNDRKHWKGQLNLERHLISLCIIHVLQCVFWLYSLQGQSGSTGSFLFFTLTYWVAPKYILHTLLCTCGKHLHTTFWQY